MGVCPFCIAVENGYNPEIEDYKKTNKKKQKQYIKSSEPNKYVVAEFKENIYYTNISVYNHLDTK